MADTRHRNVQWQITPKSSGDISYEAAQLAVLMDIREELYRVVNELDRLNNLLRCPDFLEIPTILRSIRRNTSAVAKKRKGGGNR